MSCWTPRSSDNCVRETVQTYGNCQLSHQITNREPNSHLTRAQWFKMATLVRYVFGGLLDNDFTKSEHSVGWVDESWMLTSDGCGSNPSWHNVRYPPACTWANQKIRTQDTWSPNRDSIPATSDNRHSSLTFGERIRTSGVFSVPRSYRHL
jgi:hypothetical protein